HRAGERRAAIGVERGALVRVLAVAQVVEPAPLHAEDVGQLAARRLAIARRRDRIVDRRQIRRDRRIVRGGVRERLARELEAARASKPPWIFGCSVLTRPSRISGAPVCAETCFTAMPAAVSAPAVPPVERISKPSSASARPSSSTPRLSDTESNARRMPRVYH